MPRLPRALHLAAIALVGASACANPVIGDRWPVHRVVGHITDPAGQAVAGAVVSIRALWGTGCSQTLSLAGPFTTDARGRYRGGFSSGLSQFDGCVEVSAAPPASASLQPTMRRVVEVRIATDLGDSLVADLQLNASR
ncbi:MAG: carboxypeptidase regulatory-like domain-containing protein [Gemmatimonadaceae bacterium]|nr:carboxypeptidase regulatory-like domain-containing protein [Gemmatimonadaceae bacterium]